jgi:hypothetical protein
VLHTAPTDRNGVIVMPTNPTSSTKRGMGLKLALVGGGLAAGVIVATAIGANAATSGSGTTTAPNSGSAPAGHPGGRFDPGGANPVRSDEKSLGSALTAKLNAAALKAVPGGTVIRIESDSGDGTYEAHMNKADGSLVTVKFGKAGTVTSVEQGMGK